MVRRLRRAAALAGLAAVATACAGAYVEPELGVDQVVLVEAEGPVSIAVIDGFGVGRTEKRTRVRVAPGERAVPVSYPPPVGWAAPARLVFTAHPGQTYRIRARVARVPIGPFSGRWEDLVVHAASGAVVATDSGPVGVRY